MEIHSKLSYPSCALSNLTAYTFIFSDIVCASMESFLQSLKVKDCQLQKNICRMTGIGAKNWGSSQIDWKKDQILWWNSAAYDRHGNAYQQLLDRAYMALLLQNENYRTALLATNELHLTHMIGKTDPTETVLTQNEFCSRLLAMRAMRL